MTTATYRVTGVTCEHCVRAVRQELLAGVDGVTDVAVALVPDGISAVMVTSGRPLDEGALAAALDEAGDYRLAAG
jgi:copper chaperone